MNKIWRTAARRNKLSRLASSGSHPDLNRAPYVLYGVKYIDLVARMAHHTCGGRPQVEARLASWTAERSTTHTMTWVDRPMLCMVLNILA